MAGLLQTKKQNAMTKLLSQYQYMILLAMSLVMLHSPFSSNAQAPQITSITPAHNAEGIAPINDFYIKFDQTVTVDAGRTISLKRSGKTPGTLAATNSSNLTFTAKDGYKISFLGGTYVEGEIHFIEIPNNVFKNVSNQYFSGTDETNWSFRANNSPTNITLDNSSVTDGNPSGTSVGLFSATDDDVGQSYTYTLITGTGDADNDAFSISGNELTIDEDVDYETQTSYSIRVEVTDDAGGEYDQVLVISVVDIDDTSPVVVSLSPAIGSTNGDVPPILVATFDEDIAFAQMNAAFYLRKSSTNAIEASWFVNPPNGTPPTAGMSIDGNQITFDPSAVAFRFDFNTTYRFTGHALSDLNGNEGFPFPVWEFTTRAPSTENDVLSVQIPDIIGDAVIDATNHTITATVAGASPSQKELSFVLSPGATGGFSSNPQFYQNGVAFQYNVAAESGAFQPWQITLNWEKLDGTYTVGDNGQFDNLRNALQHLVFAGLKADVVFEVEDGYVQSQTAFLSNPDPTYNVLIRPEAGATQIELSGESNLGAVFRQSSSGLLGNFTIDGADPVTGDIAMNVNVGTTSSSRGVYFLSSLSNIDIKNLRFKIEEGEGIRVNTTTDQLLVEGCEFVATNSTSDQNIYGIYFSNPNLANNCIAISNRFYNQMASPDPNTYSPFNGFNDAINNSVAIRGLSTTGIFVKDNALHNSVYIYGTGTEEGSSHIAMFGSNIDNNLIVLERSAGVGTNKQIFFSPSVSTDFSNNNIYIVDDGVSNAVYASSQPTQQDVLTLAPTTSFSQVDFTSGSTGDLSLSGSSLNDPTLRTSPLAGVADDINGVTRSTASVSKGAFESPNNLTDILTFSMAEQSGDATINAINHTVFIETVIGSDLSALSPSITISAGATIDPASGTEQDFTSDVDYTVTAEDGTEQIWIVSATRIVNSATDIISWSFAEQTGPAVIDEGNHTVEIEVSTVATSYETRSFLTPTFELSFGATGDFGSGIPKRFYFGSPFTYTITGEDGTSVQEWEIIVTGTSLTAGTYSVETGGDMEDLLAAFHTVRDVGISGDVVLEIEGDQNDTFILNRFIGTEDHSLTIRPSDDATPFTLSGGSLASIFQVNGIENLVIDGKGIMTIENRFSGTVMSVRKDFNGDDSPSKSIMIKNATFISESGGVTVSDTEEITIQSNTFLGKSTNNENLFRAISLGNDITGTCIISENLIAIGSEFNSPNGDLLGITTGSIDGEVSISNNVISFYPAASDRLIGVFASQEMDNLSIDHNTISFGGTNSSPSTNTIGIEKRSLSPEGSIGLNIRNNIINLASTLNSGEKEGIIFNAAHFTAEDISGNNVSYTESGSSQSYFIIDNTPYNNANFSAIDPLAPGTTRATPIFSDVATNDFHLSGSSLSEADLRGLPVATIAVDKDNNSRSSTAPSKGAFESPNNIGNITSFTFDNQVGDSEIDSDNFIVNAFLSPASSFIFAPQIDVFAGATVSPVSGASQDFNSPVVYTVTSEAGNTQQWTVIIQEAKSAPTDILLDNTTIAENETSGTVVGTLTTTDVDAGETYTYTLVSGTGSTDNTSFTIDGAELKSASMFNFETKDSYSIRVNTNDGNGGDFEKAFTIAISDVSETPTDVTLDNTSIDENEAVGTVVGTLSTTDVDAGETYTYTLVSGTGSTDNASFTIDGDELKSAAIFVFETKDTYSIRVSTNDGNGGDFAKEFTITVNGVSEAPTDIAISNTFIAENQAVGTAVGNFSTTDADVGETYTYTLVSGTGATDNASFTIDGDELKSAAMFDFETKDSYSIRVNSNDGNGGDFAKSVTIFINDVSDIVVWDGSVWSNTTGPTAADGAIINGNYSIENETTLEAKDLTVNSPATLRVEGGGSLELVEVLLNNSNIIMESPSFLEVGTDLFNFGSIVLESGSSLITYEGNEFSQNGIEIRRNTHYANGKYSFAGSPVEQDASIVGSDLGSYVYKYNEVTAYGEDGINRWEDASADQLVPAKGYAQADQQEIIFTGAPNTGTIIHSGTYTEDTEDANEGWNLVANPYAAAINVTDFLAANINTSGSVYIWDDNGSDTQRGTNADYIVANGTMATNTTPAGGQTRYNNHLGSSQGFFVKLSSAANTDITFTEGMRRADQNEDDNFFRKTELPIARLNLTNDEGLFKQTVIGFASDASENEINRTYDAQAFNATSDYGLFTVKAGITLTLNGMVRDWETIQLQFNVKETGQYEIAVELESYDQPLYLKDNLTGVTTNLKNESYSFNAQAGINTDRFVLASSPNHVLGLEKEKVLIYASRNVLHIRPSDNESRQYQLFNMQGRQLITTIANGNKEINLQSLSSGVYLVFDGEKTHKIILD